MKVSSTWLAMGLTLAALVDGCGAEADPGRPKPGLPTPPQLMQGMGLLRGDVTDLQGKAVPDATVSVLETGAQTTSDGEGHYQLMVTAGSTITVRTEAAGFAPGLANAVIVADGQTSTGHDLALVSKEHLAALAQLAGTGPMDRGVVAVTIKSMSGACQPEGGLVAIEPRAFGRVVYARPDADATPEPSLTAMQAGSTRVGAWILGVVPPGAYYSLSFSKPGCNPLPFPVEVGQRSYTGALPIQAGAVSHALVFTE
jgi:hypothetical protein